MPKPRPTYSRPRPRREARTIRGIKTALWVALALTIGIGVEGALSGPPKIDGMRVSGGSFAAQSRNQATTDFVSFRPMGLARSGFASSVAKRSSSRLPAIAIVIDDLGNDAVRDRRAIALPHAVTLSFLPYTDETPALAREGALGGHEILVHVPMQPKDGEEYPGPMALRADLAPSEIVRRLDWALSRVPDFAGINNHMGSRFTEDRAALVPVAEELQRRGVFFFDSRTTPDSQVVHVARSFGVPSAARDVFLDDVQSPGMIAGQLAELERDARANGVAIAIGHPHEVTLDALARWSANLNGYELVPVSVAIRMKMERETNVPLAALGR